jgi:Fe-S oxidoreductase
MVTREEKYSTRGRARLLFEMLHGGPLKDGWRSDEVEEALDFCLGCKGCKSDCPVHVDMATYKAEFRAHHYAGRLRPRAAYSMGLIHRWARIASHVPNLANGLLQMRGIGAAAKWLGGIAQGRQMPRFASESFTDWFRRQPQGQGRAGRVLLWPDTFNNYFRPQTAIAATALLQRLGYEIAIPDRPLCCGRALYDWGMLGTAKSLWRKTFASLMPEIEAGTPIVGLEPACVTSFRDELPNLFPGDQRAKLLSGQTVFLTELLGTRLDDIRGLGIGKSALVQIHCNHHAVIKPDAEIRVLDAFGLDHEVMPSGCCGMAGAFGFEADKYELSMQLAERVMLPMLRAKPKAMAIANGFSCREQIEQSLGRDTLHIAEVLADAAAPEWRHTLSQ